MSPCLVALFPLLLAYGKTLCCFILDRGHSHYHLGGGSPPPSYHPSSLSSSSLCKAPTSSGGSPFLAQHLWVQLNHGRWCITAAVQYLLSFVGDNLIVVQIMTKTIKQQHYKHLYCNGELYPISNPIKVLYGCAT
ncbi:uncharacterized protein UHO2_07243 [Ustilago hordei]|uniref:Secreted protein n=1 Tax=Ustilago hordei TaxID=120017 RepID=I2FUR0_USTHO|nr:uncharacterized protein UHO2_07243 [Ustilago hordei]CCF50653.1 uncharacterized protein UHOR_06193 [Ustilago hordei]SYW77401.1 uncharacterized protein UHO2_07243 [Ustilago hordei]